MRKIKPPGIDAALKNALFEKKKKKKKKKIVIWIKSVKNNV